MDDESDIFLDLFANDVFVNDVLDNVFVDVDDFKVVGNKHFSFSNIIELLMIYISQFFFLINNASLSASQRHYIMIY